MPFFAISCSVCIAAAQNNSVLLPHAPVRDGSSYERGRAAILKLNDDLDGYQRIRNTAPRSSRENDGRLDFATEESPTIIQKTEQNKEEEEEGPALIVANTYLQAKSQGNVTDEHHSIVASLKECAEQKDLIKGIRLHHDITRRGLLEKNIFIGNALISMYGKCGVLDESHYVCNSLPVRNEVSWNSIIAGYTQHGHGEEALRCFTDMQDEGLSPNSVTYTCVLKAIGSLEAIKRGEEVHAQIVREGILEQNVVVGTALVDMYAKCGLLVEAHMVLNQLSVQSVVSYNALIAGYTKGGHGEEALSCFEQMQLEGPSPNMVTFISIAKACGSLQATEKGRVLHADIVQIGIPEEDNVVPNALIDMYAKCGQLAEAHSVFYKLPSRDKVSFSALIAGCAYQGQGEQALEYYEQMQDEGLSPDAITIICVLKACIIANMAGKHEEIHAHIVRAGLLEQDLFVGSALVDMYAKCGLLKQAKEVFDELPVHNVVAYSSLIAGYAEHGPGEEALNCFECMQLEGIAPNTFTLVQVLRACANIRAADRGEEIHNRFIKDQWLERELVLCTALADMYAKLGSLTKAQEMFDKLPVRDLVSWNALIAGYTQHGHGEEALYCLERMQSEDISPDEATFSCILKACASMEAPEKGQETHAMIVKEGDLEEGIMVKTALVDMYAKCGLLAEAQDVFDRLPGQNVVLWNALMGGYAQHGLHEEVLDCFRQMQLEGISPNAITFIAILKACSSLGAVYKGQEIHVVIARERLLEDVVVSIALADMYAKSGQLGKAQDVLDRFPVWDVVLWNTLLAGHSQLGKTEKVFELFDVMLGEGINPDLLTFTIVLNSCSHAGLVHKGQMYFEAMSIHYGIIPTVEQYTCMVDLFCRAGHLDKALALTEEMLPCANLTVWLTLLRASQTWGQMKIGILAFNYGAQLGGKNSAAYVCMSNIYAVADDGG